MVTMFPMDLGILHKPSSAAVGVATATFITKTENTSSLTTYTFSGQTLAANMAVAIMAHSLTERDISTVTIGGVSATIGAQTKGNEITVGVAYASGITPGTGDIVVTFSATATRCGIGTWELENRAALTADTASTTFTAGTGNVTVNLDVPANGFVIAVIGSTNESHTYTWTNATKRYGADIGAGTPHHSGASENYAAAQTNLAVSANRSASVKGAMCALSFGPA